MEVAVSINCPDFGCLSHRFLDTKKFLPTTGWVHLDIADARFTYHRTWNNPAELKKLLEAHPEFRFNVGAHLMVEEPEKQVRDWFEAGVKRVIVHIEAILDTRFRKEPADPKAIIRNILGEAKKYNAQVFLSSNPETPVGVMAPYLDDFSGFQVLSVRPGSAGQKFLPVVLDKIRFLRQMKPDAIIEVDGGMNLETGGLVVEAGANALVAANFIFGSKDMKGAFEALLKL